MNVIVGWIVGNTQSGPHSFRKEKPFGWQYSDGLVTQSYHEAEVARLRAELNAATKAGLDAIATICEKEREVDVLRNDALKIAQTLAWQCFGECRGFSDWLLSTHESLAIAKKIQAAMGEGK